MANGRKIFIMDNRSGRRVIVGNINPRDLAMAKTPAARKALLNKGRYAGMAVLKKSPYKWADLSWRARNRGVRVDEQGHAYRNSLADYGEEGDDWDDDNGMSGFGGARDAVDFAIANSSLYNVTPSEAQYMVRGLVKSGHLDFDYAQEALAGLSPDISGGLKADSVEALKLLKYLKLKKKAEAGAAEVKKPSTRKKNLWERLGLNHWVKHSLTPAVQIRVRKGYKATVKNIGTEKAPVFQVTPGGSDKAGALGVLTLAASAAAKPLAKAIANRRELARAPYQSKVHAGETITVEGFDEMGAVLIDSDGYQVDTDEPEWGLGRG